ncbi:uncharacterized protein EV420DRAFT_1650792 [Desarmillaria tabescens]|uniref:Uncharacterized protein n=1 Tax=Armillaria tabescens TaxID=1929756 RepID=A0AA39JBF2_ARMTA|nr:uncharacterized protein EV420DRAFT_1650792 [Desarmillaria tabescens]KAK0439675.1 hypothetical protein EV420DRAFT_1650792 [Desarmillaria tabescens]
MATNSSARCNLVLTTFSIWAEICDVNTRSSGLRDPLPVTVHPPTPPNSVPSLYQRRVFHSKDYLSLTNVRQNDVAPDGGADDGPLIDGVWHTPHAQEDLWNVLFSAWFNPTSAALNDTVWTNNIKNEYNGEAGTLWREIKVTMISKPRVAENSVFEHRSSTAEFYETAGTKTKLFSTSTEDLQAIQQNGIFWLVR